MLYTDIENMVKAKLETDGLDYTITEVELKPDQIVIETKDETGQEYQLLLSVDADNKVTIDGDFTAKSKPETPEVKADEAESKPEVKADEEMAKIKDFMCKSEEMMSKMNETCSKIDAYNTAQEEEKAKKKVEKEVEAKAKTAHWLDGITNE